MKFTPKEKRFIHEFMVDLNATQAAIRAGYSAKSAHVTAHDLLKKPPIRAAIDLAQKNLQKKTEVTAERVIEELARIAFSKTTDFVRWNESGVTPKSADDLTDEQASCIHEVIETTNQHGGSIKVKLYDKIRALELLSKHLGLLINEKSEKEVQSQVEEMKKLKALPREEKLRLAEQMVEALRQPEVTE